MRNYIRPDYDAVSDEEMQRSIDAPEREEDRRVTSVTRRILARLSPGLAAEYSELLASPMRGKSFANPKKWSDETVRGYARSLLDASEAVRLQGRDDTSVASLLSPDGIAALKEMLECRWSAINLWRVLCDVRKVHRAIHGTYPLAAKRLIDECGMAPTRDLWSRMRSPEQYIDAALLLTIEARQLTANGHLRRGRTRLRDAAILAVVAAIIPRRGEISLSDIKDIIHTGAPGKIRFFIEAGKSKARIDKILEIQDERVSNLLDEVLGGRNSGPLFITNKGNRLSGHELHRVLVRTSVKTLEAAASFNIIRRSGISAVHGLIAKRGLAGHSDDSQEAEKVYQKPDVVANLKRAENAFKTFPIQARRVTSPHHECSSVSENPIRPIMKNLIRKF